MKKPSEWLVVRSDGYSITQSKEVVTPFGELTFNRTFETDDPAIAAYFNNHIGYTVTQTDEAIAQAE